MIEPSSADHSVATLNRAGVRVLPLWATNSSEKSRVISARSIATNASKAPAPSRPTYSRDERSSEGRPVTRPTTIVIAPTTAAARPSTTPAVPRAAFMRD